MLEGCCTLAGTMRLARRFPESQRNGFYRQAQGRLVSSLGLGTYLGEMDEASDKAYTQTVMAAIHSGVNFLDTSLNYRHQRSERAIGEALSRLKALDARRDELFIATKAGYLVPGAVPQGFEERAVRQGHHCMEPEFLADQLERSRNNLGLEKLDLFYLHNPEAELSFVPPDEFYSRIERAFRFLEQCVSDRKIAYYGAATWDGFRLGQLDLGRMLDLARQAGGAEHHFRFLQMPVNLAMLEALRGDLLREAHLAGLTVVASASLLQARLLRVLPHELIAPLVGDGTQAQAAIQFTRSVPGVTVALVGMGHVEHLKENLGVSTMPPLDPPEFQSLFEKA